MENPLDIWRGAFSPIREFDKMLNEIAEYRKNGKQFEFNPAAEVEETDTAFVMKFDLPGVDKKDVKLEIADNRLTVSAERKEEKKKDTKKSHLAEVNYGSYFRSFTLPTAIDEKKTDAKLENGVLTVTVPKMEAAKAKQISIN